jgi:glucose/arabinose dehydrogenase
MREKFTVRLFIIALALLALLLVGIPAMLLLTGAIDTSSVQMVLNVMTGRGGPPVDDAKVERLLHTAPGFSVALYSGEVPRARYLLVTPEGDLLVSRPHAGDIVRLKRDADGDGHPDGQETVLQGLNRPLGMDIADGWLYVAQSDQVGRVRYLGGRIEGTLQPLVEGLTDNGNHWSKTTRIGPDGLLYLSQGSTCNVCEEEDSRRATMMRFQPDGSNPEIFATGLRNSAGFDWAPWSGELYATENGRDMLGDDFPPCELNRLHYGGFFGWPYFNGDNIPDPDMGPDPLGDERSPVPPAHEFRAHNAPLGLRFINAGGLPDDFQRTALAALHGSWNRSEPDGYKVVSLHFVDGGIEERDFLWGFNSDGDISGRPVDVAQAADGSIYVSDDYAGAIYRITPARVATAAH